MEEKVIDEQLSEEIIEEQAEETPIVRKAKKGYAVITGASSGIGEEFAIRLAAEGYRLVLIARREDRLKALAESLEANGTECTIITADLAREEECHRVMDELADKKIGIFINNAGFGTCGHFPDVPLETEINMIDVNIKAVHILTKLVINKMKDQKAGYILNVASSAGLLPAGPYMATYYATKAYVTSLTRAVARELKEQGSNLYLGCLCPGPVDTEFNEVANVEFSLKGISAQECVSYAISQMKKKKTVIIPSNIMKLGVVGSSLVPDNLLIGAVGGQQKKKQGL